MQRPLGVPSPHPPRRRCCRRNGDGGKRVDSAYAAAPMPYVSVTVWFGSGGRRPNRGRIVHPGRRRRLRRVSVRHREGRHRPSGRVRAGHVYHHAPGRLGGGRHIHRGPALVLRHPYPRSARRLQGTTVRDGDRILDNMARKTRATAGMAVLRDGTGLVVRRVDAPFQTNPTRFRLISANPACRPYGGLVDESRIAGTALRTLRRARGGGPYRRHAAGPMRYNLRLAGYCYAPADAIRLVGRKGAVPAGWDD